MKKQTRKLKINAETLHVLKPIELHTLTPIELEGINGGGGAPTWKICQTQ